MAKSIYECFFLKLTKIKTKHDTLNDYLIIWASYYLQRLKLLFKLKNSPNHKADILIMIYATGNHRL